MPVEDIDKFLDECLCADVHKAKLPEWVRVQVRAEKVLAGRMIAGYRAAATKAVTRAANMAGRGEPLEKILKSVKGQMNNLFTEDQVKRFSKDIVRYYKSDRQISVNDFHINVVDDIDAVTLKGALIRKQDDSDLPIAFDIKDTEIVKLILAQNLIAAQNFYKQGISAHVVSVIRAIVRDSGLSQAEQKKRITSEMSKALGLKKGKIDLKKTVPPKFKGDAKDYYTGLAQTTLTRAQTMGRLNLFSQGTVKKYTIQAIIDTRTSTICLQMNGRQFTIEQGEEQVRKVLTAKSSAELKQVAGWRKDLSDFGVKNQNDFKSGPSSLNMNKSLAENGLSLPPYHFRCRSTIRPV